MPHVTFDGFFILLLMIAVSGAVGCNCRGVCDVHAHTHVSS